MQILIKPLNISLQAKQWKEAGEAFAMALEKMVCLFIFIMLTKSAVINTFSVSCLKTMRILKMLISCLLHDLVMFLLFSFIKHAHQKSAIYVEQMQMTK